jgi:hypothetical protein
MVSVGEYKDFVKNKAIPAEIGRLDKCMTAAAITKWRKDFFVGLSSKIVVGENPQDVIVNP